MKVRRAARFMRQRGAALLMAMVVVVGVAAAVAGMTWQQSRALHREAAARAQLQAEWILTGALDWAHAILREDLRLGGTDHLGEPWAIPIAQVRLATFLSAGAAVDTVPSEQPDKVLTGRIVDAQSRYNLRNLLGEDGRIIPAEMAGLQRLCDAAGVPADTASRLADKLRSAWAPSDDERSAGSPIAPTRVPQLVWLGLDAGLVARLERWVVLLPGRTPVNVNTAAGEVLVAAVDGLDIGSAERLVELRRREPFAGIADIQRHLPEGTSADALRIGVASSYFLVHGSLQADGRVLEQQALVERRGAERGRQVLTLWRERRPFTMP